jgi:hypothetical protein
MVIHFFITLVVDVCGCRSVTARKYFMSDSHAYLQLANKDKGLRNSFCRAYLEYTESTSTFCELYILISPTPTPTHNVINQ